MPFSLHILDTLMYGKNYNGQTVALLQQCFLVSKFSWFYSMNVTAFTCIQHKTSSMIACSCIAVGRVPKGTIFWKTSRKKSLNRLPIWNSQNCSMFPLAFVAGSLQGHLRGFISRNYVVWPIFFLMNVFVALKGTHFRFLFATSFR